MNRFMILAIAVVFASTGVDAQDKRPTDTPKAAKSRKKLREKVTVDYENTAIREIQADLVSQIDGLPLRVDFKGGVSGNLTVTFKADKKSLEEVLDGICKKKGGLGFYVESNTRSSEDGTIWISNRANERGYRVSDDGEAMPAKEKGDTKTAKKDKGKNKSTGKDKDDAEAKEKKAGKEKSDAQKTEDDPDKMENDAARKLSLAKILLSDGKTSKARTWLEDIVAKFPNTKAASEARDLLKKLDK